MFQTKHVLLRNKTNHKHITLVFRGKKKRRKHLVLPKKSEGDQVKPLSTCPDSGQLERWPNAIFLMDTKTTGPDAQPTRRTREHREENKNRNSQGQAHGHLRQDFKERQRFMLRHMYDTTCMQISVTEALSVCLWVPPPHRHQNKQAGFIQAIAIQQKMLTKPFSSNSSNPLMWTEFCIQMLHEGSVWTELRSN